MTERTLKEIRRLTYEAKEIYEDALKLGIPADELFHTYQTLRKAMIAADEAWLEQESKCPVSDLESEEQPKPKQNDMLEDAILDIVKKHFNEIVDVDKVNKVVEGKIEGLRSQMTSEMTDLASGIKSQLSDLKGGGQTIKIEYIKVPDAPPIDIELGVQHKEFQTLLDYLRIRENVYVYGPTGTGKTKACFIIAKQVLKCPIRAITLTPQTSESKIFGYMDAHGNYVKGAAYDVYKEGGILVINELDNGNAASNGALNQLSDEECFFPCGPVERHKDFCMVATANTLGTGANRQYVGRSPQDKALLNRFIYLPWGYDLPMERALAVNQYKAWGGKEEEAFCDLVMNFWQMRQAIDELQIDHILSSRNLIEQQARICAVYGMGKEVIQKITRNVIARGMEIDQFRKVVSKANTIDIKFNAQGKEKPKMLGMDGMSSVKDCPI